MIENDVVTTTPKTYAEQAVTIHAMSIRKHSMVGSHEEWGNRVKVDM